MNGGDEERRRGKDRQTEISSIVFERARICNFLESTLGDDKIRQSFDGKTAESQLFVQSALQHSEGQAGLFWLSLLFIFSSPPMSRRIWAHAM